MIELTVIIALICLLAWEHYQTRKERNKLINAIIAKDAKELKDLDFVDKLPTPKVDTTKPDLVPFDQMDEEEFDRHIEEELKQQNA